MSDTERYVLTRMEENQESAQILFNELQEITEGFTGSVAVEDRDATAPPTLASTDSGKVWLVPPSATGAWAGQDGNFALYIHPDAGTGTWRFVSKWEGTRIWMIDEDWGGVWNGTAWIITEGVGTAFPTSTNLANGSRFIRSDLGETFSLMDATAWGGTGQAWVGDQAETWAFGMNKTSGISGNFSLGTFGNSNPTSATVGILCDVDQLITVAKATNDQSFTGDIKIMVGAGAILTLTFTAELTKTMARGAANWIRVSAGDILWCQLALTTGTVDDPVFSGLMRHVIDA